MNYGTKKKGFGLKENSPFRNQPAGSGRRVRSYAKDTTGPGVMQEVPRDRAAPLARPYKRRPKMNVQKGMYASE
ncbi:MAG: hypothetical protein ACPF8W_03115 [Luminiphilus sp.]